MATNTQRLASLSLAARVAAGVMLLGVAFAVIAFATGWTWLWLVALAAVAFATQATVGVGLNAAPARFMQDDTSDDPDEEDGVR